MSGSEPVGVGLWELVTHRASASPDRVMWVDERGRSFTAPRFLDAAECTAAALAERGVGSGTRVSWQLPNVMEAPVLLAALARLEAVQNPIIPQLRHNELGFILEETEAELLVVPDSWRGFDFAAMGRDVAAGTSCQVLALDLDAAGPDQLALPHAERDVLAAHVSTAGSEQQVRWVFYTSGTTQRPKGAMHSDASLLAATQGMLLHLELDDDDVVPIAFPITHIGGALRLVAQLQRPFFVLLMETFDAERSPLIMAEHGATLLGSAVPFFNAFLAAQRAFGDEPLFPNLRACVAGGAPVPPAMYYELQETLGGLGVLNGWGLTEFPLATFNSRRSSDEQRATTVGVTSPGVQVRVVTLDGDDAKAGEEGELRLKGPQVFSGYLDRQLDRDAFDDHGYFRTGDLGTVDHDGYVRVTGRIKDIVIRNGENISTLEVEGILSKHPAIAELALVGLPDERTGERCCAVVVLADEGAGISLDDVARHCEHYGLARYKIPEQLEIVDAMPRNAMGKVVKTELRARFVAGIT